MRQEGQINKWKWCANVSTERCGRRAFDTHKRFGDRVVRYHSLTSLQMLHSPKFCIYLWLFLNTVPFWYESHADKTRLIKVSNYLSSQHDQWQMECIFSFLPAKKRERESCLRQDIKLFWFTQVLSKNLRGRTIKGVGDHSQPLNKAESNQPGPKVRTPERVSNAGSL